MSTSSSPEELLAQLARTVPIAAACVPDSVRRERPRLAAVAVRLGIETTLLPTGHEELLCQLAADQDAVTAEVALTAARSLHRLPFLLLIPRADGKQGAALAGARELTAGGEWLVRDLSASAGPALLAPLERVLGATDLAGEWSGRSEQLGEGLARGEELIGLLWRAAERDRESLAAIAQRVNGGRREVEAARRQGERAGAELARLRSGERHELDRLRLEMLEERAWVSEQAMRIASSTSWRVGHRLTRFARRLVFKPDRGTNLPQRIAERMQRADPR